MRHVNLREGWRAPRRLARYLWQGCFACRPMDEAYLLASNSIRCGRAWRGGAQDHPWGAPAIPEARLAHPDPFAQIDLGGGGRSTERRAEINTRQRPTQAGGRHWTLDPAA